MRSIGACRARAARWRGRCGARVLLLAEDADDAREIAWLHAVDDVGGGRPVGAHAHVERPVGAEGEAALGLVELHGGDADVEHDAVDAGVAMVAGDRVEVGEAAFDERQPVARRRLERRAGGDRRAGRGRWRCTLPPASRMARV